MKGIALREPAVVALETMRAHKLRSFLMLLGTILAVSTLIVVVALVEGTNQYIADRIATIGSNVFIVSRLGIQTDMREALKALKRNKPITFEDYEWLRDNLKLPRAVGAQTGKTGVVRREGEIMEDVSIRGVTANIAEMGVEEAQAGRYVSDTDDEHRATVTMIGADLATRLFPGVDPLGKVVLIDGQDFTVVGVAKPLGTAFGQSQDNFVYIPIQTFLKVYGGRNFRNLGVNVQARGAEWMAQAQEEARMVMRARRHQGPGEEDKFGIIASATLMDLWKSMTAAIANAMIGFVSVFLVIGGVVIMNVMLASVTERTREIGIRKSCGARRSDIMMQFLVEASVMAGMGGAIGVTIAFVLSYIVRAATSVPMAVPLSAVIIALALSTGVGLFFGIYPASKAAKLDPIEALRYET
jgi:putative ABC transport system permease protein